MEAKRGLDITPHSLLAEDVSNVIGAESARGMSFAESGSDCFRSIIPNESEEFSDLSGEGTVGVSQATQIEFGRRTQ